MGEITDAYREGTKRILAKWMEILEKKRLELIKEYMRKEIEEAQKKKGETDV